MSYCRWSTDGFKCDLYCYEDVSGGWTTHVAGRRRVGELPESPFDDLVAKAITSEQFTERYKTYMDAVGAQDFVDIDLPHAGETFNDSTLKLFRDRLVYLRGLGYSFPDGVLAAVDEEIAEEEKHALGSPAAGTERSA